MPSFIDTTNNTVMERLQGTVRERDKVMRGFKKTNLPKKFSMDSGPTTTS
jgi:hypothetical protein